MGQSGNSGQSWFMTQMPDHVIHSLTSSSIVQSGNSDAFRVNIMLSFVHDHTFIKLYFLRYAERFSI